MLSDQKDKGSAQGLSLLNSETEERRNAQIQLINDIGRKVLSTLELGKLYGEVVHMIQAKYDYYQLSLWILADNKSELVLRAQCGYRGKPLPDGFRVPISKGIIGWTARNVRSRLVGDVAKDPYYFNFPGLDTRSEFAAPIESKGQLLGVLNVESNQVDAFDETDAAVIETITGQFAIAILNARLYDEVKSFNAILREKVQEKTRELQEAHEKILEQQRLLKKENRALKTILSTQTTSEAAIIGSSEEMTSLLNMVDKISPTNATVLIQGESGTGKELIAKRLHLMSHRAERPYVAINCGALQESLLASELFGHEKGAFTGADHRKIGLVETADGGTLLLDEIGEMGISVQAKLLRFLQEGEIYRVGGKTPIRVDVRILSASNRDLDKEVAQGNFREDLFYRLNTITLRVPPLRERRNDIPLLVEHFLKNSKFGDPSLRTIAPEAMYLLQQHNWPGNVRELQNAIERIKILAESDEVSVDEILRHIKFPTGQVDPLLESSNPILLDELERIHILRTLNHCTGNKTKAAKVLGVTIKTLYNKLHKYSEEGRLDLPQKVVYISPKVGEA